MKNLNTFLNEIRKTGDQETRRKNAEITKKLWNKSVRDFIRALSAVEELSDDIPGPSGVIAFKIKTIEKNMEDILKFLDRATK